MAFKEYGSYDAVGLADLVRKKQVTPQELLDEAIARTAKVDPQINAVVVKHYDYAERQIDTRPSRRPLHRRAVSAEGSRSIWRARARRRAPRILQGLCRRSYRHAGAAFSRCRRGDLRQELQSRIRPDADHGIPAARADPQSLESRSFLRRFVRRRGRGGRRPHPSRGACQRRRRFDPYPRLGFRRVRIEADPRAQSARPRSRRRLGRIFLSAMSSASAFATAP